ncbi:DUF7507 domain-containing protein [Myroides odoratimimus]|uniref:DUF7507 domain-containing protein n=1 Tax=Myroides odoratimimus TaxID=76832 RepID=UPI0025773466|nr:hypothetical protein [Myroides odoratimimus]MDM1093590.1 hypothetical protein [Myroides odoratimimus]MDM1400999.1 hypothetical protein [Myroides odoratimimus]MDM1411224.1 hypothetical protein [Myroides odoratimimus]MDM1464212.1 hypothetical protein [Myroides odoratimimus]MDM1475165.1 hypothetical protein [Myroides odoratimimus]
MIYKIINKITVKVVLTLSLVLGVSTTMLADGSRNLYPSGVKGHRAFLLGKGFTSQESIPFPNEGAHYVYAKVGETITMASSAQGNGRWDAKGGITLYNPSGSIVVNNNQTQGQIPNRSAELAGPKLSTSSQGGYTPIYYEVPKGGEGIYRVEFTSRNNIGHGPVKYANDNWKQSSDAAIAAWDVSVINGEKFVDGRVFTTNLNFTNGNFNRNETDAGWDYQHVSFQGEFFVRTNDGFTYKVTHKGSSGIVWAFFVNNNGFFDYYTKNSLYKSMNSEASRVIYNIHNPNTPDNDSNITHKIYYTLPAKDMPNKAKVAINSTSYGLTTWLNPTVIEPEVSNVKIVGAEGTVGIFGHKGGYIEFDAPVSGQQFTIDIINNGSVFKRLEGNTKEGHNKIYWDGVGANGQKLKGVVPIDLNVQLQGAEVHFPFFDMEYNIGGIAIELLDYHNYNNVLSDLVFWDDSDIPNVTNGSNVNPKVNTHFTPGNRGISSNTNGHKWGANGTGAKETFGDKKSMDTWTFRVGNKKEIKTEVVIKEADLYTNITYKVSGTGKGHKGDTVDYIVTAGNKGPSDIIADASKGIHGAPFTFTVPPGVDVINPKGVKATFKCANGNAKESVALAYDPLTRTFRSELQIPNGCTVEYKITGVLNGMTGSMIAESTIMRPADVSDPDATNGDPNVKPTNPHYECYNNDSGNLPGGSGSIGCNNINEVVFMALGECVDKILYFEDFDRGYWNVNSGRTDWSQRASISIGANGEILRNQDGSIQRQGPRGGATVSYLFAPGVNDSRYAGANRNPHSETISVARIKNGYYSVNPPGYVQMGIPTTDSWHEGIWVENAPSNDPTIANSNFDWTPAWDNAKAIRDMSGAVNGSAFLVRGAASAAQSIKPFYEFELAEKIEKDRVYTLDIYSYVTYHDKDYMIMDVLDKETGHIYASVPLKYGGVGLPEGAKPEGFSLGWVPLTASFTFADAECVDVLGKDVKIAIRGSQDRALETGKGFGHTLIDNITFSKRIQDPSCGIHVSNITCADECYQDIVGKGFGWFHGAGEGGSNVVEKFQQPATDGGFVVDIYRLDNSFNMVINGVPLYKEELEFETGHANRNVRFKSDGKRFGERGTDAVWDVNKNPNGNESENKHIDLNDRFNNPSPVIRVNIDKWGNVTLWGKRTTDDSLEELEVYDRNNGNVAVPLQVIHWISEGTGANINKVDVTQNVIGQTMMYGFGYGQQQKECETCTIEKEGVFTDESKDGYAQVGETILYTFDVKNAGDMDIEDIEIIDPLFGFTIKLDEHTHQPLQEGVTFSGDNNNNGILNRNETWTFTVSYTVTETDIFQTKGVYNRATVKGVGKLPKSERKIEELSTDPTPYQKGDEGWDADKEFHTYVPLKGNGLLITNPMIYQKVR